MAAARRPFRVEPAPKGKPSTDGEKAAGWPGQGVVRAQREGGPLPDPADVAQEQLHGHSPRIPWPAAQNGPKPFKNTR